MAILISSHNLAELDNLCNKVCIIKNGKIIESSSIEKIKNEVNSEYKIFEIDDTSKIKNLLPQAILLSPNQFKINLPKEKTPEMVAKLVINNVLIYGIMEDEKSLEDIFFEKTGGNVIE